MLKRNKSILSSTKNIILFSIFFGITAYSQQFTNEEKQILELKDSRSLGADNKLLEYLNSEDPDVAFFAAFALANIADANTIKVIGEKLIATINTGTNSKYSSMLLPEVLAFALGQMDSDMGSEYLLIAMQEYSGDKEKLMLFTELINSLSKVGGENELNHILKIKSTNDQINSVIAMAIARFGLRKIKNDNSFLKLAELMEQTADSTVRRNIAFAFYRIADKNVLQAYNTELVTTATSPDPYARMWGISAIGKQQDTASVAFLIDALNNEIDWRVKVNIASALGNYKIDHNSPLLYSTLSVLLEHGINDQNTHVSIAAWQAVGKLYAGGSTGNLLAWKIQQDFQFFMNSGKTADWQIKAEAIKTYAKIFRDEVKDELFSFFKSTDNYDIKSAVVGSFGFMDSANVYKELRQNVSNDVQKHNELHPNKDGSMIGSNDLAKMYRAFVDALVLLDDKMDTGNRNIIRLILSEFASSKDPVLTENCLANLQDTIYMQYRAETCQIMMFDYRGLVLPKHKDIALMYIQAWSDMKYDGAKEILTENLKSNDHDIAKTSADALKNITGNDFESQITSPKYRTDLDWEFIGKLQEKKYASIKTNKGFIKIELYPEIAPFTVQNFVKLSEKGYYDNTIFHRVIPNFVIQGGDPTGTGFGGPGYSIRSEFSPLSFNAYTLGMASSGKDTEGSQFFITHSPQPHLDSKYTIFGTVVEGFDVVDKIQLGDLIEIISFSSR